VLVPLLALGWWREGFAGGGLAVPLAAAFLLSVVLTTLVKYAVRRSRPQGEWGAMYRRTDPHSFPSGHASRTAALTLVALARGQLLFGLLLGLWSLLVGFARIAMGVHYLLDVLAGYLLGLAIGAGVAFWLLHGLPW
jgi:undecaprenyl-diphosphatase